jgi:hypothetical protein
MAKWVIRRALDRNAVSEAIFCAETRPVLRGTGVRSVDEYIEELLVNGERVDGHGHRRPILRGDEVVGFVELSDARPHT